MDRPDVLAEPEIPGCLGLVLLPVFHRVKRDGVGGSRCYQCQLRLCDEAANDVDRIGAVDVGLVVDCLPERGNQLSNDGNSLRGQIDLVIDTFARIQKTGVDRRALCQDDLAGVKAQSSRDQVDDARLFVLQRREQGCHARHSGLVRQAFSPCAIPRPDRQRGGMCLGLRPALEIFFPLPVSEQRRARSHHADCRAAVILVGPNASRPMSSETRSPCPCRPCPKLAFRRMAIRSLAELMSKPSGSKMPISADAHVHHALDRQSLRGMPHSCRYYPRLPVDRRIRPRRIKGPTR